MEEPSQVASQPDRLGLNPTFLALAPQLDLRPLLRVPREALDIARRLQVV